MSWTYQLLQTYEKLSASDTDLTPIAHMYVKAQLEVIIDSSSSFIGASLVGKGEERTLIPVTEASSGRSSGSAPHALNDTLSYIAGDFANYSKSDKERKMNEKKHQDYMTALEKWCNSDYSNEKVFLICEYLKKNQLMSDLNKAGIVHIEDGNLSAEKINGNEYAKVLVRFRVFDTSDEDCTWEDKELIEDYSSYYLSMQNGDKSICLITGEYQTISENHPKNIVSAYGNAKLMSANDGSGYTFRGRFENSQQASTVSYEASQKLHSALKWLVSKQGRLVGTKNPRMFLCWNPEGKETINLLTNSWDEEEESYADSQLAYRNKMKNLLSGKREIFNADDKVILMTLDAATTGRLSITYYQELLASTYWDHIEYWVDTVNWEYLAFENKKAYRKVETPPLWKIIVCAFGVERESNNMRRIEADDAIVKEHIQRLIKCMLEKQRMPKDIVVALFRKASNPLAYSSINREMLLSTACAVITRYKIDSGIIKEGDDSVMKLDKNNSDRSYLFGRLLAIYERIERISLDKDENRETNAIRLQAAFVNHPAQTWNILEDMTKPYFKKLKPKTREFFRQQIEEIVSTFEDSDMSQLNKGLTEEYLLGYYLQRKNLHDYKSVVEEVKDNE